MLSVYEGVSSLTWPSLEHHGKRNNILVVDDLFENLALVCRMIVASLLQAAVIVLFRDYDLMFSL